MWLRNLPINSHSPRGRDSYDKEQKIDLRKAGVQLSAQLLDREDRVLVLGMRALQTVVHAPAQAVVG